MSELSTDKFEACRRLKGTYDLFGQDADSFRKIEETARTVFGLFGFQEIRTPYLEEKRLFTHALGTDTDVVKKEMYEFIDKSSESVALRPEGTAGVVRAYIENNIFKTQGLAKFFYLGPMFRRERPQKGRLRQFHQIGVEQLGTGSPYADAETIHCLVTLLKRLKIKGYKLKLNNLGTFEEREAYKVALKQHFSPLLDKLCEDCRARYHSNIFRILDCKIDSCHALVLKAPVITNFLVGESKEHYTIVKKSLKEYRIPYKEEPHMVRGLDYRLQDSLARIAMDCYEPTGSNIGLPNTPDAEFYNSKRVQMALSGSSRTTTVAYHLEAWERDDKGRVVREIPGATDPRRRLKPVSVYTCIDDPEKSTDEVPIDTIVHSRTPNVTITSVNPLNEFLM